MPPMKQPFDLVPIPKKRSPIPVPLKKPPLERGGVTPSSPPHPKKTPSEKEKIILAPFPLFLKLHLRLVILSIELNIHSLYLLKPHLKKTNKHVRDEEEK